MNEPSYGAVVEEMRTLIVGDVSVLEEDRERAARDTSIFYLKNLPSLHKSDTVSDI